MSGMRSQTRQGGGDVEVADRTEIRPQPPVEVKIVQLASDEAISDTPQLSNECPGNTITEVANSPHANSPIMSQPVSDLGACSGPLSHLLSDMGASSRPLSCPASIEGARSSLLPHPVSVEEPYSGPLSGQEVGHVVGQEGGIADFDLLNYLDLNRGKQRHRNSTIKKYSQPNDAKDSVTREELVTDNSSVKNITFVDLDNNATFYYTKEEAKQKDKEKKKRKKKAASGTHAADSDLANDLCMVKEEDLRQIEFKNYCSSSVDKRHLKTKCVKHLKHFYLHEVGREKNAADARMLGDTVQTHFEKPLDISFVIMSGDRAFEVLPEQFLCRKVQFLNFHREISVKTLVEGPTDEYKNSQETDLGKVISMLARSGCYTNVYFVVLTDPTSCFGDLEDYLKEPYSAVLVFGMEPDASGSIPNTSMAEKYKNRLWFYYTSRVSKEDAPLFLLAFAALALHYKDCQNEDRQKAIDFHITFEKETVFASEIQTRCIGRNIIITNKGTGQEFF